MSKNFDYEKEINELEYPRMFIAGLKSYIERNKLKINNKKELDKIVDEFKNIKA